MHQTRLSSSPSPPPPFLSLHSAAGRALFGGPDAALAHAAAPAGFLAAATPALMPPGMPLQRQLSMGTGPDDALPTAPGFPSYSSFAQQVTPRVLWVGAAQCGCCSSAGIRGKYQCWPSKKAQKFSPLHFCLPYLPRSLPSFGPALARLLPPPRLPLPRCSSPAACWQQARWRTCRWGRLRLVLLEPVAGGRRPSGSSTSSSSSCERARWRDHAGLKPCCKQA